MTQQNDTFHHELHDREHLITPTRNSALMQKSTKFKSKQICFEYVVHFFLNITNTAWARFQRNRKTDQWP